MKLQAKHKQRILNIAISITLMLNLTLVGCINESATTNSAVVNKAQKELNSYASNTEGEKYWYEYFGLSRYEDGSVPAWCACFVSYVANEAGLIEAGYAPKSASVAGWINFYKENSDAGSIYESSKATPLRGDFVVWDQSVDSDALFASHIGIVAEYDATTNKIAVIEGNYNGTLARNTYRLDDCTYILRPAGGGKGTFNGCSSGIGGDVTDIPAGLGTVHSWMAWSTVTDMSSNQYKLREAAGEAYDDDKFAKIGERYVIACTLKYGAVGDYINWTLDNGEVIHTVVGDIKSYGDKGCNEWGHLDGDCIVEFVMASDYSGPGDPTMNSHQEWFQQPIISASNLGSYWNGDSGTSDTTDIFLSSCSSIMGGGHGQAYANASEKGKAIVDATETTPAAGAGYCLKWVGDVYDTAGYSFPRLFDAKAAYQRWCKSNNRAELEVGMLVATAKSTGTDGEIHGHIGIYIGDDQVISQESTIKVRTLDEFIEVTGNHEVRWGWPEQEGIYGTY